MDARGEQIPGKRGRWRARWRTPDGKQHTRHVDERRRPFTRKGDAEEFAIRQWQAAQVGTVLPDDMTVGEWLDHWLVAHVKPRAAAGQVKPRYVESLESNVRLHLKPWWDDVRLHPSEFTPGEVTRWQTSKLGETTRGRPRSPRSVKAYRAALSAAASDAVLEQRIPTNPVVAARAIDVPEGEEPSVFSHDEFDRIVAAAGEHRLGAAVLLGAATGMRRAELAGLRWSDVDLDAGVITIRETVQRVSSKAAGLVPTGLVRHAPKSGDPREYPIAPGVERMLRQHRAVQAAERLEAAVWVGTDAVFCSTTGTPLEGRQIARALAEVMDAAGVVRDGDQQAHELRRTWATRQAEAGTAPDVLMKLGGWKSMDVPTRHYLRVRRERLAEGAAATDL